MKSSWLLWFLIIGIIVSVLIAFNYHGGKDAVSLSEIFPEEEALQMDIEYEFVDAKEKPSEKTAVVERAVEEAKAAEPAVIKKPESIKIAEREAAKEVIETPVTTKAYTIQVASFRDTKKAKNKVSELKEENHQAYIVSRDLGSQGVWYRVYVGSFDTKTEAQAFYETFHEEYQDSFILSTR